MVFSAFFTVSFFFFISCEPPHQPESGMLTVAKPIHSGWLLSIRLSHTYPPPMATVGRFWPTAILYCSLLASTFCLSRAYSLVAGSAVDGSMYSEAGGVGIFPLMFALMSTLSPACPVYCASSRRAVERAFSSVMRLLRVSLLFRRTCSMSFLSVTPAATAASASLPNLSNCRSMAATVFSFSFSMATCQK